MGLRAFDANGYIVAGAKATVYATGTTTLIDVWTDADGSVAGANPIIADGNGYWPQRFVTDTAKVVITDADDAALQTLDPAPTAIGTGSAASDVSFSPTVEVPFTNVQDAIQGVSASVVSGVSAYGIGITGNAPLLANIDATNIAAGVYRFDGTTTGTYPTGLVAADTGLVETWRQSATAAMMEIGAATGNLVWRRRLVAGTWGAWRQILSVENPSGATGQTIAFASGLPVWSEGGRVFLASKTASASASLIFTEFYNSAYRYYEFEFEFVKPATNSVDFYMQTSTDAGGTYFTGGSDYSFASTLQQGGSPTGSTGSLLAMPMTTGLTVGNAGGEFGVSGSARLYFAPAGPARFISRVLYENTTTGVAMANIASRRNAAEDTDAVRFLFSSGNITTGTIRMYGLT